MELEEGEIEAHQAKLGTLKIQGKNNSFFNTLDKGGNSQFLESCNFSLVKGNDSSYMEGTLVVSLQGIMKIYSPIHTRVGFNLESDAGWSIPKRKLRGASKANVGIVLKVEKPPTKNAQKKDLHGYPCRTAQECK